MLLASAGIAENGYSTHSLAKLSTHFCIANAISVNGTLLIQGVIPQKCLTLVSPMAYSHGALMAPRLGPGQGELAHIMWKYSHYSLNCTCTGTARNGLPSHFCNS